MENSPLNLALPHIKKLLTYSSARDEFSGEAHVFLDANENPFPTNQWNRYPDPHSTKIKNELSKAIGFPSNQLFIGNGSDEAIDLLFRIFCQPGVHKAILMPPTYGMYQVSAAINNVETIEIPLNETFQPNLIKLLSTFDKDPLIRILFICSPNNPTGNLIGLEGIKLLCSAFKGIVVIDEAYIDFCEDSDQIELINQYNRVVILHTLSKAFGLAAIRLGIAIGHPDVISLLNKIKPPYNISGPTQQLALDALTNGNLERHLQVESIKQERQLLSASLQKITMVERVYPSDANFLLVKFTPKINATSLYQYLLEMGIVVRDRSKQIGCDNCLRITIGTESENQKLLDALLAYNLL